MSKWFLALSALGAVAASVVAIEAFHPAQRRDGMHWHAVPNTADSDPIELPLDDDAEAAGQFAKLTGDRASDARLVLARHYLNIAPALAAFYQATDDIAEGRAAQPAPRPAATVFQCEAEIGPASTQAYFDLNDRFSFAEPKHLPDFARAVASAMKERGRSCDLMGLWAEAILRESEWNSAAYPIATQETAVRILVAVGESHRPFHEGEPSPGLFLLLSGYFDVAKHDSPSALVALVWAKDRLRAATALSANVRSQYAATISRRRAALLPKVQKLREKS